MRGKDKLLFGLGLAAIVTSPLLPVMKVDAQQQQHLEQVIPINLLIKDATPPRTNIPSGSPTRSYTPPPPPTPPPTPPPPPPPLVTQPPPILRPTTPFSPPIVVQTDTTSRGAATSAIGQGEFSGVLPPDAPPVSEGILVLADNQFPSDDESKQPTEGILVRAKENALLDRPSPYAVKLSSGTILVSVRKPSHLGLVSTPLADVALSADGDLLVSAENGVLHVLNASARGVGCKIRLHRSQFGGIKKHTFAINPGCEFTAGDRKLTRADLRPADGIARRRSQVFEDGRIALSEFSVHGLLVNSELVAMLNQKESGAKERRILADLSKMAAVLNHVNGSVGYSYGGPSRLAAKPKQTH